MKVLLIHRYFWPDSPPYASLLRTIAEHLSEEGHDVHVLTAQPSYGGSDKHRKSLAREQLGDVAVRRARLLPEKPSQMGRRIINLGLFGSQVFGHVARRRDYDVVMAATTPPIFIAFMARMASFISGAKFVYHMQDIYPEVMSANEGKPLGFFHRMLRKLDSWTTEQADRLVVLSKDMERTIEMRHATSNVRIINNFLPDKTHGLEGSQLDTTTWKENSYQVVFAGNLGNFQGLDHVVDAFKILDQQNVPVHLVLLGSGAAEQALREQAKHLLGTRVFFPGRVSQVDAESIVSASDLALVTLNAGVIDTAFPSKTMTYLSCGTPVLAAVDHRSELAELLTENGVGIACELEAKALASAVTTMQAATPIDSGAVIAVSRGYASASSRLPQWSSLMAELSSPSK